MCELLYSEHFWRSLGGRGGKKARSSLTEREYGERKVKLKQDYV
jgi:hypothetical protein